MKGGLNSPISKSMRKHWVPLFDQYGLDAAFENDHHVYKRSKLLKGDKTDPSRHTLHWRRSLGGKHSEARSQRVLVC
jgi:hypothetical protein